MTNDFDKTPSFFKNEESFSKYLGNTSYYLGLQKNISKLIEFINPKSVLELGSATGGTTILFASKFPNIKFIGIDFRNEVVKVANHLKEQHQISNIDFFASNMLEIVKEKIEFDMIYLLYSFHHIEDPLDNKIDFLRNTYNNMKNGSYLCIAETFIPDEVEGLFDNKKILHLWNIRKNEGYASTFWASLAGIDNEQIKIAQQIGKYCSENEYLAGELVAKRKDEFLIQASWLITEASKIGFSVVINEPINFIEDRIILFRKD